MGRGALLGGERPVEVLEVDVPRGLEVDEVGVRREELPVVEDDAGPLIIIRFLHGCAVDCRRGDVESDRSGRGIVQIVALVSEPASPLGEVVAWSLRALGELLVGRLGLRTCLALSLSLVLGVRLRLLLRLRLRLRRVARCRAVVVLAVVAEATFAGVRERQAGVNDRQCVDSGLAATGEAVEGLLPVRRLLQLVAVKLEGVEQGRVGLARVTLLEPA
eukprot:16439421-Heterocapsa_arctica.AAC.1